MWDVTWPNDWKISMCPWQSLSVTGCRRDIRGQEQRCDRTAQMLPCLVVFPRQGAAQASPNTLFQSADPLQGGGRMYLQAKLPTTSQTHTLPKAVSLPSHTLTEEQWLLHLNEKYSSSREKRKFALQAMKTNKSFFRYNGQSKHALGFH